MNNNSKREKKKSIVPIIVLFVCLFLLNAAIEMVTSSRIWRVGGWGVVYYPEECLNKIKIFLNIYEYRYYVSILITIVILVIYITKLIISKKENKVSNIIRIVLISLCIFQLVHILCNYSYTLYYSGKNKCAKPLPGRTVVSIEE